MNTHDIEFEDTDSWFAQDADVIEAVMQKAREARGKPAKPDVVQEASAVEVGPLSALLDDIERHIRRFVVMSDEQHRIAAVWVAHTHVFGAFGSTPYLNVFSPVFGSGKTRLLEVLETLAHNPMLTSSCTAAAITRTLQEDGWTTLMLDEYDELMKGDNERNSTIHGVLNSGYKRSGNHAITEPQGKGKHVKVLIPTFGPKAIAGNRDRLPDATESRCIPFLMQRRLTEQPVERFFAAFPPPEGAQLKAKLEAWAASAEPTLDGKRAQNVPDGTPDRVQEIWEPLLLIADLAGGEWPETMRAALVKMVAERRGDERSWEMQLFHDIKTIFDRANADFVASVDLLNELCKMDESKYQEWWWDSYKDRLTKNAQQRLAQTMKGFAIKPRLGRPDPTQRHQQRGYARESFSDAWERYSITGESDDE